MALKFLVCELLTHKPIGQLGPKGYKFNDPIWGGGSCELNITIPSNPKSLRNLTRPDELELFILDDDQYVWSGIINYRLPDTGKVNLLVKAQNWKAWTYTRLFPDKRIRLNTDKYTVAYEIIDFAQAEVGTPKIVRGTVLSGDLNDHTIEPWWSVGKTLDTFGQRSGGYEWDIRARSSINGVTPELYFQLWEPGEERGQRPLLFLDALESTNFVNVGPIPEDATEKRSRVWGTGEGQPGDQPVSKDEDPALAGGRVLLRETVSNWSGVTQADTLFNHTHSERLARTAPFSQVIVDHAVGHPDINAYSSGDRARLRVSDGWNNLDIRGIRIIDRTVSKAPKGNTICTVTLDFSDVKDVA